MVHPDWFALEFHSPINLVCGCKAHIIGGKLYLPQEWFLTIMYSCTSFHRYCQIHAIFTHVIFVSILHELLTPYFSLSWHYLQYKSKNPWLWNTINNIQHSETTMGIHLAFNLVKSHGCPALCDTVNWATHSWGIAIKPVHLPSVVESTMSRLYQCVASHEGSNGTSSIVYPL